MTDLAQQVAARIEALGQISDEPGHLTRTFCSSAMRRANDLVASWMREAGMTVREDAIGNVIGHFPGPSPEAKIFLLGSHLDTVRDAGKFDGPLGVALRQYLERAGVIVEHRLEGRRIDRVLDDVFGMQAQLLGQEPEDSRHHNGA